VNCKLPLELTIALEYERPLNCTGNGKLTVPVQSSQCTPMSVAPDSIEAPVQLLIT
jgi:hypothetical protein